MLRKDSRRVLAQLKRILRNISMKAIELYIVTKQWLLKVQFNRENTQIDTTYPLKKPNIKPNVLSIEPKPVHVTALLNDFPATIVKNIVQINKAIPKPTLLIKSDSIYSLTQGCNFGTKIIVITRANTHFINEMKLKENPLI